MTLLYLIGGLAGLLGGAQLLVIGATGVAKKYGISEFLIGLTLVTVGTSVPELVVSVVGAIRRLNGLPVSELIVSEIVGSGIGQIGLVLGLAGLLGVLHIDKKELKFQGFYLIGSVLVLLFFSRDGFLSPGEGWAMLLAYGYYLIHVSRNSQRRKVKKKGDVKPNPARDIFFIILGLILVVFSSDQTLTRSIALAESWHISQSLIGLFLVGLGTSMPELVVSLTASARNHDGLSAGNLIGSNIFVVLGALSAGVAISGFNVDRTLFTIDIPFLLFLSGIVMLFFYTRDKFERKESFLVLGLYSAYVFFKIWVT